MRFVFAIRSFTEFRTSRRTVEFDTCRTGFYDARNEVGRGQVREPRNEGKSQVDSFGERMRREREMRGVSLDDIAEGTKIGTRLLRDLEEEQFELLPGEIFNKGFVRAYAKYLGLNEEEALARVLVRDFVLTAAERAASISPVAPALTRPPA